MSDFSEYSLQRLTKTIDIYTGKLLELELEDSPNQVKIETIEKKLGQMDLALKEKTKAGLQNSLNESMSGQPSAVPGYSALQKELQNAFRDVNSFSSGCDVHVFINTLELYYSLYVKDSKSDQMEQMFVRLATTKMSTDYAQTMQGHQPIVDTFERMKDYLKVHHASRMSSYQYLDTCWELEKMESENLRDYAHRIHDKMVEARNTIEAKYEAYRKSRDSTLENVTMASKDVFDMVSGQIFLQYLKNKNPRIFNQIVSDLDEVWNAADIANRAMAYQDRMCDEEGISGLRPETSLTIDKKSGQPLQKKGVCRLYLEGKCKFSDSKCWRLHDKDLKQFFEEQTKKPIDRTIEDSERDEVYLAEAFVPANLPTQNFRQ